MLRKTALILATIIASNTWASPPTRVVIAQQCLLKNANIPYEVLSTNAELALAKISSNAINTLINAKHRVKSCGGFMDVTEIWRDTKISNQSFLDSYQTTGFSLPQKKYNVRFTKEVDQVLKAMNPQNMWDDLTKLSSFKDRYANSDTGVEAANWLKTQFQELAKQSGHEKDVTVYTVATGSYYKQPSVVAKFGKSNEPGVVIGGHMDTLSSSSSWPFDADRPKPGADDDGTGSVTVLEVARLLLNSGMEFKKPIYFIWYSAEEEGLIGSQYVVKDFVKKKIPVSDVLQFDMTGYRYRNESTMWLMDDFVNKDLTSYVEKLINTYVNVPVKHSRCGYGCSDHASWTAAKFRAAMPFESEMNRDNPDIHTSRDTMDHLSLEHMTNYAKLAAAAAIELAEPAK